jgi:hypothetical protein
LWFASHEWGSYPWISVSWTLFLWRILRAVHCLCAATLVLEVLICCHLGARSCSGFVTEISICLYICEVLKCCQVQLLILVWQYGAFWGEGNWNRRNCFSHVIAVLFCGSELIKQCTMITRNDWAPTQK